MILKIHNSLTSIPQTVSSLNEETESLICYTVDHFSPVTNDEA